MNSAKQEENSIVIGIINFKNLREGEIRIRGASKCENQKIEGFRLHIPDYQRPYAWEEKQVETLLNDLKDVIESKKKSYLLGSLIFHENTKEGTLDVVDGQQRLVTLALICKALDGRSNFLMQDNFPHSESQKNLKNNFSYIQKWFRRQGKEVEQNIMGLLKADEIEFVCIVTPNLDDAFIFFDSANSKGKALETYDLVKAYHLSIMNQSGEKKLYQTMCQKF